MAKLRIFLDDNSDKLSQIPKLNNEKVCKKNYT